MAFPRDGEIALVDTRLQRETQTRPVMVWKTSRKPTTVGSVHQLPSSKGAVISISASRTYQTSTRSQHIALPGLLILPTKETKTYDPRGLIMGQVKHFGPYCTWKDVWSLPKAEHITATSTVAGPHAEPHVLVNLHTIFSRCSTPPNHHDFKFRAL